MNADQKSLETVFLIAIGNWKLCFKRFLIYVSWKCKCFWLPPINYGYALSSSRYIYILQVTFSTKCYITSSIMWRDHLCSLVKTSLYWLMQSELCLSNQILLRPYWTTGCWFTNMVPPHPPPHMAQWLTKIRCGTSLYRFLIFAPFRWPSSVISRNNAFITDNFLHFLLQSLSRSYPEY